MPILESSRPPRVSHCVPPVSPSSHCPIYAHNPSNLAANFWPFKFGNNFSPALILRQTRPQREQTEQNCCGRWLSTEPDGCFPRKKIRTVRRPPDFCLTLRSLAPSFRWGLSCVLRDAINRWGRILITANRWGRILFCAALRAESSSIRSVGSRLRGGKHSDWTRRKNAQLPHTPCMKSAAKVLYLSILRGWFVGSAGSGAPAVSPAIANSFACCVADFVLQLGSRPGRMQAFSG